MADNGKPIAFGRLSAPDPVSRPRMRLRPQCADTPHHEWLPEYVCADDEKRRALDTFWQRRKQAKPATKAPWEAGFVSAEAAKGKERSKKPRESQAVTRTKQHADFSSLRALRSLLGSKADVADDDDEEPVEDESRTSHHQDLRIVGRTMRGEVRRALRTSSTDTARPRASVISASRPEGNRPVTEDALHRLARLLQDVSGWRRALSGACLAESERQQRHGKSEMRKAQVRDRHVSAPISHKGSSRLGSRPNDTRLRTEAQRCAYLGFPQASWETAAVAEYVQREALAAPVRVANLRWLCWSLPWIFSLPVERDGAFWVTKLASDAFAIKSANNTQHASTLSMRKRSMPVGHNADFYAESWLQCNALVERDKRCLTLEHNRLVLGEKALHQSLYWLEYVDAWIIASLPKATPTQLQPSCLDCDAWFDEAERSIDLAERILSTTAAAYCPRVIAWLRALCLRAAVQTGDDILKRIGKAFITMSRSETWGGGCVVLPDLWR